MLVEWPIEARCVVAAVERTVARPDFESSWMIDSFLRNENKIRFNAFFIFFEQIARVCYGGLTVATSSSLLLLPTGLSVGREQIVVVVIGDL